MLANHTKWSFFAWAPIIYLLYIYLLYTYMGYHVKAACTEKQGKLT